MFTVAGIKLRKAFFLACFSVLPDLDVLFGVHRSVSHSVIVWFLVLAPVFMYFWRFEQDHLMGVVLVFFSGSLHCIFDTFYSFTPLLWPLVSNSLKIDFSVFVHVSNRISLEPFIGVQTYATDFEYFSGFDATLFTSESFVVSLALLAPVVLQIFKKNRDVWLKSGTVKKNGFWPSFLGLFYFNYREAEK